MQERSHVDMVGQMLINIEQFLLFVGCSFQERKRLQLIKNSKKSAVNAFFFIECF
jgi:hypothetical protein